MGDIMKMIPGLSRALPETSRFDERDLSRIEAIICSMTRARTRAIPIILNGSRRKRIALGSGTQVSDVNRLVKQFEASRQMMKQMGGGKKGRRPRFHPECLVNPTDRKHNMVKIRLRRMGAKKQPTYRFVVPTTRAPRDGRFIEILGHYNPRTEPKTVVVDAEKAKAWLAKGAQPSDPVRRLFAEKGLVERGPIPTHKRKPKSEKGAA